ncbi:phosphate ABC transporter substrate-binding protein PstS [Gephyromycinifex aptenodytis]|uniref:phosphate ABC transporter substrate-binding protein PstS n=1 Tax=Gephyromycinifex aptenodytis TaxID=2716227 RepID=UPI00144564C3|nr:phosphate ABC transporter substrate-binding protein PstS [Gephyromycinifex aptenodytis]
MKRTIFGRTAVLAIALPLALSACGAANEGPAAGGSGESAGEEVSGTIAGAGASSQAAAVEAWKAGFEGMHPGATVNYDPVGSGGGREQFLAGGVQFAGSDAYLKKEELSKVSTACKGGELIEFPAYISPIAVPYKLDGVDNLQLSPETLAGIFAGKITAWNDPAIVADNPGVTLPSTRIAPVHRSDKSGTTENFTDYLAKAAPKAWPHEPEGNWPISGGEAAKGTSGVMQAVNGGTGTIGYADASQIGDLPHAKIKVGQEYTGYSPEAAAKVVDASERVADRSQYDFAIDVKRDTTESGTYPIVLVTYTLACTKYDSAEQAKLVKEWLSYITSDEGQKKAQEAAGSAPISESARENAKKAIDAIAAS